MTLLLIEVILYRKKQNHRPREMSAGSGDDRGGRGRDLLPDAAKVVEIKLEKGFWVA